MNKLNALLGHLQPRYLIAGDDLPPVRRVSYDYIVAGNGLWKRAANDHLEAQICIQGFYIPALPILYQYIHPVSLFPGYLLRSIYEDAAGYAEQNLERMYFLHVDGSRAWVSMPAQETQNLKVDYRPSHSAQTVVCDLHSHHNMRAFFSGPAHVPNTDDHDEKGFGFYAVIGSLLQSKPELRLRLGVYGDFVELHPGTLFEGELGPFVDAYSRPEGQNEGATAEGCLSANSDVLDPYFLSDELYDKLIDISFAAHESPEETIARLIENAYETEYASSVAAAPEVDRV